MTIIDADDERSKKFNIFEAQDSKLVSHEVLARIGLEDAGQIS